jgi:hypothetical protein
MGGLVWLASYPKSGNTWTRNFLNTLLADTGQAHDINAMKRLTPGDSGTIWYQGLLERPLAECSMDQVASVRLAAQAKIAEETKGLTFVKTHNALVSAHGAPMINLKVTAGVIYIVRNPLDVAISFAHHMGTDIPRAIRQMNQPGLIVPSNEKMAYQYYGSWSENVHSWTRRPIAELFVMRYEDMLEKPSETFGRLCKFLLLTPADSQLDAAIEATSFEKLRAQEEARGFTEKPKAAARFFREGRAGQWKEALSEPQVRDIVSAHREEMARFGYLPEGY